MGHTAKSQHKNELEPKSKVSPQLEESLDTCPESWQVQEEEKAALGRQEDKKASLKFTEWEQGLQKACLSVGPRLKQELEGGSRAQSFQLQLAAG